MSDNIDKTRILVIGDGGVGKTSYIRKQIGRNFIRQYYPTNGINMYETDTIVWYDFPGQEKYGFHPINDNINRIIYMYDVTSNISYKNINYWKEYVQKNYGDIPSITIGNKSELPKRVKSLTKHFNTNK
jgi:GTP-binding nuclear protein Ran